MPTRMEPWPAVPMHELRPIQPPTNSPCAIRLDRRPHGWYGGTASPPIPGSRRHGGGAGGIAMKTARSARGVFYSAALGLAAAVACRLRDETRPMVEPPPPGITPTRIDYV